MKRGLISSEDMHFFKITDNVDVAVREVTGFYQNFHSSRYVGDQLVIRLQRPISNALMEKINDGFMDIVTRGRIDRASSFREESDEPDLIHLPRLVLRFNRKNFGRLRQLIDALNEE
jgi:hypothetical protein